MTTVGYLMVSTWRFYSFKDIDFRSRHPVPSDRAVGRIVWADLFLLAPECLFGIALLYMVSGVFWRLQWIFRRRSGPPPPSIRRLRRHHERKHAKPTPTARNLRLPRPKLYRAAIVGAGSLKGKEVAEMLNERNFPAADIRLLDDDEALGTTRGHGRRDQLHPARSRRAVRARRLHVLRLRSGQHAAQLERRARRGQHDRRSLRRSRRSAGRDRAFAVDRARARASRARRNCSPDPA